MNMDFQSSEVRKKIRDGLEEISRAMTRIESEKDLIKEIIKKLSEDFNIPKSVLNKVSKLYHKQNFNKELQKQENIINLYEIIFGNKGE